jgi:tetratricopeptide (TPR) repeat protein
MKKPLARTQKEIDDHLIRAESERYANPRNAKQHCKQALELAESISDTTRIAKARLMLGTLAFEASEFSETKSHCECVLKLDVRHPDLFGKAYNLLGLIQWQEGNHPAALESYLKAIDLWKKAKLTERDFQDRHSRTLTNIGHLYTETSNYEKALDYYFQALDLLPNTPDPHVQATLLRSIGSVYEYLQEFDKAIDFFKQSLEIVRKTKNALGESATRYNLGNTLWLKGSLKESLRELEQAAELAKAIGDKRIEAGAQVIKAAVLADLGEKETFNQMAQKCLADMDALNIADLKTKTRQILAKSFMTLNQPEQALPLFEEAMQMAKAFKLQIVEAELQQELSKYHEQQGNFEKALLAFRQAYEILEAMKRHQSQLKLEMYQVERRTKLLEAENTKLKDELNALRQQLQAKRELTEKEREKFSQSIAALNPNLSKRLLAICESITPTELKVAEMIAGRFSTKQIAQFFQISPRTVETHRENLRKKLKLNQRQSLATFLQTL